MVIGAGLGGLASAARLARSGFDVHVIEKESGPGGRCGTLVDGDFRWDIGPTILLFPDVLRRHFSECGAKIDDYLELSRCHPNYRIQFSDRTTLTMQSDLEAMRQELDRFAPGSYPGFLKFLEHGRRATETAFGTFLSRTFDRKRDMLGIGPLLGVLRSRSHRSLYAVVSEMIEDERVRMALTFQTMYLGLSPYEGPALFGLLPYTEIVHGVWHVKGGLGAISASLAKLAEAQGVRFSYGRAVREVERNATGARAVILEGGERIEADVVLANADLPWVYRTLLDRPLARMKYTSSALMFFWGAKGTFAPTETAGLHHHNVFFGSRYKQSFRRIFAERKMPEDPSFYVANAAIGDASMAPAGKSALYVLVPVPHLGAEGHDDGEWRTSEVIDEVRARVLRRLEATVAPGLTNAIECEHVMTPRDWSARFSLERGSAFGLAHTLLQVGAFRPPNRDREISNFYFVGASTQPATGIPNVLLGAKLVADRIAREQAA
ncbi:phytoene desaturase [soil metagenome]